MIRAAGCLLPSGFSVPVKTLRPTPGLCLCLTMNPDVFKHPQLCISAVSHS